MIGGGGISAAHVAVAVVTACRLRSVDPAGVFANGQTNRRARVLAAAGLVARLKLMKGPAAALLKVFPQELAPSMLVKAEVTTDELLDIAVALEAAGLVKLAAAEPPPESPPPEADPAKPAAASAKPACKPGQERPSPSPPAPDAAPSPAPTAERPAPSPFKRRTAGLAGAASRARARAEAQREAPGPSAGRVTTLKAVTDRIVGWSAHFLEAGWDRVEVAELFDVCPDALLNALDPAGAIA
jgi:hypothetical protein